MGLRPLFLLENKMKFKFVKSVSKPVPCYGDKKVKTGQEIELAGHFAEKAKRNPDFEEVVVESKEDAK